MMRVSKWRYLQQRTGWPFGPVITALWMVSPVMLWATIYGYFWLIAKVGDWLLAHGIGNP